MSELLEGLNPEQYRAVATLDGPLLILAGAGSGKTRVLTRRVAYLLEQRRPKGLLPWNILAVTFTNKAAGEMRERVEALVGEDARKIWIGTFHSTCVRILRQDIEPIGWKRDFVIYDDDDQIRLLKDILKENDVGANPKEHTPSGLRAQIDRAKNALLGPNDIPKVRGDPFPEVFRRYEKRLKNANAVDFNDIVNHVVRLWKEHPDVLRRWQEKFKYVLVDEYQDTNTAQYQLIRLLVSEHHNLAVVGDDDQSIYSFRGADISNILNFEKDFPDCAVIRLEQNYRSTGNILLAATGIVRNNLGRKDKTLWTSSVAGEPVRQFNAQDDEEEARLTVMRIREELRTRRPGDIAVIYRANAQSRPFEQALTTARIPYVVVGGKKFYERREVRDILSYLKLLLNPADDIAFQRIVNVPSRGLGDKALTTLQEEAIKRGVPLFMAARSLAAGSGRMAHGLASFITLMDGLTLALYTCKPGELVMEVARRSGYLAELNADDTPESRGRIENIQELSRAVVGEPDQSPMEVLMEFIDRASLVSQSDELPDTEAGAVTLLTAHLAKGLEYPVVFVVGMCEGLFPHSRSETSAALEEERRLAYVAVTRARERLTISYPLRRRMIEGNRWVPTVASRFLREIPPEAFGQAPAARPGAARSAWPSRPPEPPRPSPFPASRPPSFPAAAPPPAQPPPHRPAFVRPPPPRTSPTADRAGLRTMVPENPAEFRIGTEVFHPTLGPGTISRCEGVPSNPRLTIHFRDHGPRTVFALAAGLEILLS